MCKMTYFYVERDVRLPMESYIVAGFKDIIAMVSRRCDFDRDSASSLSTQKLP